MAALVPVSALVAHDTIVAAWGLGPVRVAPPGARRRSFRVVVPAHDEALVIGNLLSDLAAQRYPAELFSVAVVADRCTDETSAIASGAGVAVAERRVGLPGKGAALAWYLERHPLAPGEALVVLDADNRVPPTLLAAFADELDAGADAVQAYLDVVNADAGVLASASALTYWASARMVQLSRTRLGWGADLGGTGMCVTRSALLRGGGFGPSLVEDQDLTVRLHLAGVRARWLHHVRIGDEKPVGLAPTVRQRARWARGRRVVARSHAGSLLRAAVARRSLASADLALRLVRPSRSLLASVSIAFAVSSVLRPAALPGRRLWRILAVWQLLLPEVFLIRDGVPLRHVARAPLLVLLAGLWLPIRVASRVGSGAWRPTPHFGGRSVTDATVGVPGR